MGTAFRFKSRRLATSWCIVLRHPNVILWPLRWCEDLTVLAWKDIHSLVLSVKRLRTVCTDYFRGIAIHSHMNTKRSGRMYMSVNSTHLWVVGLQAIFVCLYFLFSMITKHRLAQGPQMRRGPARGEEGNPPLRFLHRALARSQQGSQRHGPSVVNENSLLTDAAHKTARTYRDLLKSVALFPQMGKPRPTERSTFKVTWWVRSRLTEKHVEAVAFIRLLNCELVSAENTLQGEESQARLGCPSPACKHSSPRPVTGVTQVVVCSH